MEYLEWGPQLNDNYVIDEGAQKNNDRGKSNA
jgi:hypothetical protein